MIGLIVAAVAARQCYCLGFDHGSAEAVAKQASIVETAQKEVKEKYEIRVQELAASIERLRSDNAERVRQLEKFSSARTDLATCRRERSDLARLAVRGEGLLKRAESYLETMN